jgi:type II secretory pathway pseudopilin PulG
MVVVVLLLGVVASIAIPRALKTTPRQELTRATRQLARDLELVRTQAVAAKRTVRVRFWTSAGFYTAFMDATADRDGTINEDEAEVRTSRLIARGKYAGLPGVELPDRIVFGSGDASAGPLGGGASDPVPFADDRVEFNTRGMVLPLGTQGVLFLAHEDDPSVVAAVTVSGAGSFEVWHYRDGNWER